MAWRTVSLKIPGTMAAGPARRRGPGRRAWGGQCRAAAPQGARVISDANFPMDGAGRTYHLSTKRGEVSNRVLSVGDHNRARKLSAFLDPLPGTGGLFEHSSSRGFTTYTGLYRGVPVSIVTTLMGMANMDFVVRETRAVVDNPMAFVRLGTCGLLQPPAALGTVVVARRSRACRRNPDAFGPDGCPDDLGPYHLSLPIGPDAALEGALFQNLQAVVGADGVLEGTNVTACSFYSSQGRTGEAFDDRNDALIDAILAEDPSALSLEMETFHLLDMARCSAGGSVKAASCAIGLAERWTNDFLGPERMLELERACGKAALETLAGADVDANPLSGDDGDAVWT